MLRCSGWHAQGQHSLFYQICRIATMAFCHRKEKITACIWDPCIISHEAIWLGVTSSGISADSWLKSFPLPEWSIIKTLNRRLHHGLHRDWGAGSEGQAGLKPCLDAPTFMVKKTVFAVFFPEIIHTCSKDYAGIWQIWLMSIRHTGLAVMPLWFCISLRSSGKIAGRSPINWARSRFWATYLSSWGDEGWYLYFRINIWWTTTGRF